MKGDDRVIERLNQLLAGELTAMDQYFIHSRMYDDWGFDKLYERTRHEMLEEQEHADRLIRRILFLDGTPDLTRRDPVAVGRTIPEMLENDLQLERAVVQALRDAIALCESVGDYSSREMLKSLLHDTEEDHAYWLERQLGLIRRVGLENYLQAQMG